MRAIPYESGKSDLPAPGWTLVETIPIGKTIRTEFIARIRGNARIETLPGKKNRLVESARTADLEWRNDNAEPVPFVDIESSLHAECAIGSFAQSVDEGKFRPGFIGYADIIPCLPNRSSFKLNGEPLPVLGKSRYGENERPDRNEGEPESSFVPGIMQ